MFQHSVHFTAEPNDFRRRQKILVSGSRALHFGNKDRNFIVSASYLSLTPLSLFFIISGIRGVRDLVYLTRGKNSGRAWGADGESPDSTRPALSAFTGPSGHCSISTASSARSVVEGG